MTRHGSEGPIRARRRRAYIVVVIALLAVILLVGGALLPGNDNPGPVASGLPGTDALLAPAADTRGLDGSITALEERVERIADDWRSLAALGLAYVQKAGITADPTHYLKAERSLDRSLELNEDDNYHALIGKGVLAAARHEFAESLEWGRRARAANPYGAPALGIIGDALVELGRYGPAGRAFQKMVDLRPDFASYARVAYFRELQGDVPGAIRAMSQAQDSAGGSAENGAWASYQLGELYFGSGRLDRALREYKRGAFLAPDYVLPQVGLAKVAAAQGRVERATRVLARVVERYPAPEHVALLGDLYRLGGKTQRAGDQYDLVRAIDRLFRANGVNTDLEIAVFHADHGFDPKRALAAARREYERRESIQAADTLAWALYATERYREAQRFARRALRLGTRNALFYFHAGMIAFELEDRARAERYLARALSINPHFSFLHADRARSALRRLR